MERTKKDGRAFYINMDRALWERLEEFCQKTKRTKKAAIELFVMQGLDDWEAGKEVTSE